jgi:hypothetical protein
MQRARFRPGIARTSIDSKKSFYNGVMQDLGTIQPGSDTVAGSLNDGDLVVGISNSNGNALACVGSGNSEPLIPEILSRSALEGKTCSKFR